MTNRELNARISAAIDRGDLRTAQALLTKQYAELRAIVQEGKRKRRQHRRERRAQRQVWPKCCAARIDGQPCQRRTMWVCGESAPRTRCVQHGGWEAPNVPPIHPTTAR
jgi:hypothetical protein